MPSNIVHCNRCKYPYSDVDRDALYIVQHGKCPECATQDDEKEIDRLRGALEIMARHPVELVAEMAKEALEGSGE